MSTIRRSAAAALALAATGLSMAATPAMAATVAPAATMVSAADVSIIDPNAATSLTIHKYLGAPTGQVANGQPVAVDLPALSGVVFDIYQVEGANLTTNAGWAAATDLQEVTLTQANITSKKVTGKSGTVYNLVPAGSVTTGADGSAVFNGKVGLYVGAENLSTSTNIMSGTTSYPSASITPAAPFLVTLPMTNPAGPDNDISATADNNTTWDYNLDVYPKNATNSITKAVSDPGTISTADGTTLNADHTINYTLTGSITPGMTADQMKTYVIADQLPTEVSYDEVVSVKTTGSAGATLTANTDYTVTNANGFVQVAMTPTGLAKLADAKTKDATATVVVDLQVTANAAAGDLNNTAYLIPSNQWWQSATGNPDATYNPNVDTPTKDDGTPNPPTTIPSNEVDTHLGTATLTKVDAAATSTKLAGAVFDLYSAIIDRTTMTDPKAADCTNVISNAANLKMTKMTTDANGALTMDGLQQSDYWNGATQADKKIVYCLVETQAPDGYNLNAEPTAFFMTDTDTSAAVNVVASPLVKDEKTNLANNLPLTGGAGAGLLSLGGLVVVGGTLAARAAAKKRREDEVDELA